MKTMTKGFSTLSAEERKRVQQINREYCGDPTVGQWINRFGYEPLIEALRLDEGSFHYAYPDLSAQIEDRGAALDRIYGHYRVCKRCQLVGKNYTWAFGIVQGAVATIAERKSEMTRTKTPIAKDSSREAKALSVTA
jgi:hypothetical protein